MPLVVPNQTKSNALSISSKRGHRYSVDDNGNRVKTAEPVTNVNVTFTSAPEKGDAYFGGQSITGRVSFWVHSPNQLKKAMVRLTCRALDHKSIIPLLLSRNKSIDLWERCAYLEMLDDDEEKAGTDSKGYVGSFIISIPELTAPSLDIPSGPKVVYTLYVCIFSKGRLPAIRKLVDERTVRVLPQMPIVQIKNTLNSGYVKGYRTLTGLEMQCILYRTYVLLSQGVQLYLCVRNKKQIFIQNAEVSLYRTVLINKNRYRERLLSSQIPQFMDRCDAFIEKTFLLSFPQDISAGLVSFNSPDIVVEFDLIVTLTANDEKLHWLSPIVVCNHGSSPAPSPPQPANIKKGGNQQVDEDTIRMCAPD